MDPDLEGCDVCGNKHATEDCPILAMDELADQSQVLSQARMTVPGSVEVVDLPDGTVQVITKQRFEPKQRLGPFEAKRTTQKIDIENGFILKVFGKDNSTVWLDTSDENNCNWLSLIRTADTTKSQNLMAVQLGSEIFYIVTKVIEADTELRVWYAPHYARKVGKQTEPDGKTKALLGQILVSLDNTVIAIGSDISPSKLQSIWRHNTGEKDTESLGLSWQTIQGLLSQGDGMQQTLADTYTTEPQSWAILNKPIIPRIAYIKHKPNETGMRSCRHCDSQFETLEELAKHVKEHLKAAVKDSKAKTKDRVTIPLTPTKRKRGRPAKNKVEENETVGIQVKAPFIAGYREGSTPNITQDNQENDGNTSVATIVALSDKDTNTVTPALLNISGEGYKIVVKGTDANGDNITEVHLQGIEDVVPTTSNVLPQSTVLPDNSQNEDKNDKEDILEPSVSTSDAETDPSYKPRSAKHQRINAPNKHLSRRGTRGALSKHCTIGFDDNKRFTYRCNHCPITFAKLEAFSKHMENTHHKMKCDSCDVVFNSITDISSHTCDIPNHQNIENSTTALPDSPPELNESDVKVVRNDKNEEIYKCPNCDKSFEKIKNLKRHMRGHSNSNLCRKCGKKFVRKETLQKHICTDEQSATIFNDDDKELYHCEFCGVSFSKQSYLLRHMATHTGEFKCNYCSRVFSRKESMLQHIKKYHPESMNTTEEKVYPCEQCHRVFSREVTLQNHLKLHEGAHRCEQCGRCFASVFSLEKHTCGIIVAHENGFQCSHCRKVFPTEGTAQQHIQVHEGDLTCAICKSMFSHKNVLAQHIVVCSAALQGVNSGSFQCTVCDASFPDAGSFRAHYKQHSHPYSCDRCEKLFIRVSNLRKHKCTPVELGIDSVVCKICSRKFSNERFLQRHMMMHNPPKYECEACNQKFMRIDFYNNHICVTETGERIQLQRNLKKDDLIAPTQAICPTCGKSYSSVSNLNKHMKTHGERTETCDVCGKRFHLKIALREHMQSVHTDEYKYQCQYCGKAMKCRNSMFAHVRQFHNQTIIMYECEQCGKQFRQKGNLKKHTLTHSSKRTFQCKECDRRFKFPDQLKRHEIWHTHGQRFTCEFCGKKFVMQFELKKHLQRYHSGMIYVCRFCNTECRHAHTMKRHLQHRHSELLEWQDDPSEFIKSLIPHHRINAIEDREMDIEEMVEVSEEVADEVIQMTEETTVVGVDDGKIVEETAETALLDDSMLAAQLQAQIHDPSLPMDCQPTVVEVSSDADATQMVIIQTTPGQQYDEVMSQEVAAALQSLTKQGVVDNAAYTIIQNMPLNEQTDLQIPESMVAGDQPFIILPMVTEAGNITEPATGFEATAQITTIPDGVTVITDGIVPEM